MYMYVYICMYICIYYKISSYIIPYYLMLSHIILYPRPHVRYWSLEAGAWRGPPPFFNLVSLGSPVHNRRHFLRGSYLLAPAPAAAILIQGPALEGFSLAAAAIWGIGLIVVNPMILNM